MGLSEIVFGVLVKKHCLYHELVKTINGYSVITAIDREGEMLVSFLHNCRHTGVGVVYVHHQDVQRRGSM